METIQNFGMFMMQYFLCGFNFKLRFSTYHILNAVLIKLA